jgi:uncharacterized membrane protein required for colicin V production
MNINFSQFYNPFDILFLIIILISFFFGIKNGLIKSLLNFIKWIIIFYFLRNCFDILRPIFDPFISNQTLSDIMIFFTTLIVSYILISFINRIIIGLLQPKKSISIDMVFGGMLGILRGYIVFVLIVFFINSNLLSGSTPEFMKIGIFQEIVNYGIDLLEHAPRNINQIKNLDI